MMVPPTVIKLNKTHTAFSQSAGEQTITGKGTVAGLGTVKVENFLRFLGNIH